MAINIPTFLAVPLIVTVPFPVAVVSTLVPHAIPTETVLAVSYLSVNVGGEVTTVQAPVPDVVNVLEPLPANPQNTIMQFATGGVIPEEVHVAVTPFACPLLVPIGVPMSCPLNVEMTPLLSEDVPVNVKSVAVVSANTALFQNVADLPAVVAIDCIDVQEASGAAIAPVLANPTCAIIKLPTAKLVGLTITQVVLVAPGLTPNSINATAI